MKKSMVKIAALILAAMMAGSAIPMNVAALPLGSSSTTSSNSDVDLQAALTTVKKRITIPDELKEFDYSTGMSYGTKVFNFRWYNVKDVNSKNSHQISVTVVGDIITDYEEYYGDRNYYGNPSFAQLSESQMLAKAKSYIAQLDPSIKDNVTVSLRSLNINSDRAIIGFTRTQNGIEVSSNKGSVTINKNTGELISFEVSWWGNAKFDSPANAKSESEIKELYTKLCKLTPYYKISTDWSTKKKTVNIVYEPDMTSEIDAFTGKESTIWEDMHKADGTRFYGMAIETAEDEDAASSAGAANPATGEGGVTFTKAELEKIRIDNSLITPEKAFEQLKKDKYAALSDDYVISSYDIYAENDYGTEPIVYDEGKAPAKEKEQKFNMTLSFKVKDSLKEKYTGYKNITVQLDAKTGEVLYINKYGKSGDLPKLDVTKTKAVADGAAKTYAKNIINSYKSDKSNTEPVSTWGDKNKYYETSRSFRYNRYVNGIQVSNDGIYVTVDSEGTVTRFSFNHTDDVKFPAADILTADQAFEKLYEQKKFDCYYDGWITKDGQVRTYLLYRMGGFYLNAKTGKLCNWNGSDLNERNENVTYTDIKGIPQETAILTLQRHGVTISDEKKFRPNDYIEKNEFSSLVSMALGGGYYFYDEEYIDVAEEVPAPVENAPSGQNKAAKESKYVTRTDAAVMFTQSSGFGKVSELKGIFKTPFSDVKSNDENIGSIAVAYSMGFIKGDSGTFNGTKKITRAEAMQMIYDYILSKGKK